MKFILTAVASLIIFLTLSASGLRSWLIWLALVIVWTIIDFCSNKRPFGWKGYIPLIVLVSILEICIWYDYFGLF